MEIKAAEEILKEIIEEYNQKPAGWQIACDFKGNTLVLGPQKGYSLKMMMISPDENLGIGSPIEKIEGMRHLLDSGFQCGLRPLGEGFARELFTMSPDGGEAERMGIISRILKTEPVSTWELENSRAAAVLDGPFVSHPDLRTISKSQSELDEKLSRELDCLLRSKYPMRASIFR